LALVDRHVDKLVETTVIAFDARRQDGPAGIVAGGVAGLG
jgi:hypothetical protein